MLVDGPTRWTRDAPGKPRGRARGAAGVGLLVTTAGVAALLLLWWGRPAAAETSAPGSLPTDAEAPDVEGTAGATGTTTPSTPVADDAVADVTVSAPAPVVAEGDVVPPDLTVSAPAPAVAEGDVGTPDLTAPSSGSDADADADAAGPEPSDLTVSAPAPVGADGDVVPSDLVLTYAVEAVRHLGHQGDAGGRGRVDDTELAGVRLSLPDADGLVHLPGGGRDPLGGMIRPRGGAAGLAASPHPVAPDASAGPGPVARHGLSYDHEGCLTFVSAGAPLSAMPQLRAPAGPGRGPGGRPPSRDDPSASRSSGAPGAVAVLTVGTSLPRPARLGRMTEARHPLPDQIDIPLLLPD